jgi:hypothetical protein
MLCKPLKSPSIPLYERGKQNLVPWDLHRAFLNYDTVSEAGVQKCFEALDSGFRRNDGLDGLGFSMITILNATSYKRQIARMPHRAKP